MTFQQTGVMDSRAFSQMQTGRPIAAYRKTILGKVFVTVLSAFPPIQPEGILLHGDPNSETARVDLGSDMEEAFFKNRNRVAIETGKVIKIKVEEVASTPANQPTPIEQYSDEELLVVLSQPFVKLQITLSELKSEAVAYRLVELAKSSDRSNKVVNTLEAKLSELQIRK